MAQRLPRAGLPLFLLLAASFLASGAQAACGKGTYSCGPGYGQCCGCPAGCADCRLSLFAPHFVCTACVAGYKLAYRLESSYDGAAQGYTSSCTADLPPITLASFLDFVPEESEDWGESYSYYGNYDAESNLYDYDSEALKDLGVTEGSFNDFLVEIEIDSDDLDLPPKGDYLSDNQLRETELKREEEVGLSTYETWEDWVGGEADDADLYYYDEGSDLRKPYSDQ